MSYNLNILVNMVIDQRCSFHQLWLVTLYNNLILVDMGLVHIGDDEQTVPPSFAQTVCNSFAQLGD